MRSHINAYMTHAYTNVHITVHINDFTGLLLLL